MAEIAEPGPSYDEAEQADQPVVLPSRATIGRMSDSDLQKLAAYLEELDDPDADSEVLGWIESEQDAREDWHSDDPRVREAVGNYGHDDTPALYDVQQVER